MFRKDCTKALGFLKSRLESHGILCSMEVRLELLKITSPSQDYLCQDSFGHVLTLLAGFPLLQHSSCCCFMLFRYIPMLFVIRILPCPLRVCRSLQITLNHPEPCLRPRNSLSVFICGSLPGSGCMARWPWLDARYAEVSEAFNGTRCFKSLKAPSV